VHRRPHSLYFINAGIFMPDASREITNSHLQIVPANWRDLNTIREWEKICFPQDAWPLWDIISVLTLPGVIRLKAEVDEQFAGFVAGDVRGVEKMSWIASIGVLPQFRGRGIGTSLLLACEARMKTPRVRLCVRISNTNAIRLYEQHNYYRVDLWRRYYNDGEDALVMEKVL